MRGFVLAALLPCLLLSLLATQALSQTTDGQVRGIIQDYSDALVPGVLVTLTNRDTGVVDTRLTNESGLYQFPGVSIGTYSIAASLAGFKTYVTNAFVVGLASVKIDIRLEVATLDSKVDVRAGADVLMTDTPSIDTVLSQQQIFDLPLVGQNVLGLLDVLPAFRTPPGSDIASTMGGLPLDFTSLTVNGVSTVRRDSPLDWGRQVLTNTVMNPELVAEIRVILSPVDAEIGRGNSRIQIQTRSGTNKFSGGATWNVQNSVLDANTWANKRNPGTPTKPDWYNLNEITGSYGGPILKNKSFFFVLYEKQFVNRRNLVTTPVLTDTARQGLWRYWEGWNPGPALLPDPVSFASPGAQPTGTIASVDFSGTPISPKFNPSGAPYTLGGLRCFSVFGNVKVDGSPFTQDDCTNGTAVVSPGPWDPLRTTLDSTGYIRRLLELMPHANYFASFAGQTPDGLNTGLYRWLQGKRGPNSSRATSAARGVVNDAGDHNNREQIDIKIDHHLSADHRINGTWMQQWDSGDAATAAWGTGLNASASRRAKSLSVNGTSTLTPELLNEARFGLNLSSGLTSPPWARIDNQEITNNAKQFILYGGTNSRSGKKYPVRYSPGSNWDGFTALSSDNANYSSRYEYADTLRWMRGRHYLSVGGQYIHTVTAGFSGSRYITASSGNAGGAATPLFFSSSNVSNGAALLPNFLATTRGNAGNLLNTLYGAINAPSTSFWIQGEGDVIDGTWQDVTTLENTINRADPYGHQTATQIANEWSLFFKDDFRLNKRLTLTLGVRYDFIGSPYLQDGLTNTLDGGGFGLFGAGRPTGDPFSTWLRPGNLFLTGYGSSAAKPLQCAQGVANPDGIPESNCDPKLMSTFVFVGPKTNNPDRTWVPQYSAFGPSIGFSWQVPWFGSTPTVVRAGFQRTYGGGGSPYTGFQLTGPGVDGTTSGVNTSDPAFAAIFARRALNLTDLSLVVPATPLRQPADKVYPIGARSPLGDFPFYGPDFKTPHADNWSFSIQRGLTRKLSLEIRSVNILARGQSGTGLGAGGTFDLNTPNVYYNPEFFNALENTRRGLDDPLFDQMLMGMNLNTNVGGYGPVGTCVLQSGSTDPRLGQGCSQPDQLLQRGSAHIRRAFSTSLANGNYAGVASSLLFSGSTGPGGLQGLPIDPRTGAVLSTSQRALRNGCDRLANNLTAGFVDPSNGQIILPRCFPENYLVTNPQWSSTSYVKNLASKDYNALEVQLTLRPTHGLTIQGTYSLSKIMATPGNFFTDPLRPELDRGESSYSVGSDFRTNGTFELPIGPNKLLLPHSSGWVARALEKWQVGFIYNISSGAPRTFFTGNQMLYSTSRPNIVGPWNNPKGKVRWNGQNGNFFTESFATYQDPQCASVTTLDNLQASCSLKGLALVVPEGTSGSILLSNGHYGVPLLENPTPGNQGNLGPSTLSTFPRWRLDANLSKTFQIGESKSFQLRIDATNVLNHPTPTEPIISFSDSFGLITTKSGSRSFQAKLRLTF